MQISNSVGQTLKQFSLSGNTNLFEFETSDFFCNKNLSYKLSVKDISGRVILESDGSAVKGVNQRDMNLDDLAKGIYFVTISSSEVNETVKVMVG